MSETTETIAQHTVQGSNKIATFLVLGLLGLAVLVWSFILPIIGVLYLMGRLS